MSGLADIARLREKGLRDGTWPTQTQPVDDGVHVPGWGMDWPGLARMARARRDAGLPINDRDREALRRAGDLA